MSCITCMGTCQGGCKENCSGGCKDTCDTSCLAICVNVCQDCSGDCQGSCDISCNGSCDTECDGCTGCSEVCSSGCSSTCKGDCDNGCVAANASQVIAELDNLFKNKIDKAHFERIKSHIVALKNRYIKYNKSVPNAITLAADMVFSEMLMASEINKIIDAGNIASSTNEANVVKGEIIDAKKLNNTANGIKELQNINLKS